MPNPILTSPALPTMVNSHNLPLRDIHLPTAISWWPPALGWWLVLATLVCLVAIYFMVKKIRHARRLKRVTNETFHTIKKQFLQTHNKIRLAQQLSTLLRRASISFYPRQNTAGLTGKNWLNYLDDTSLAAKQPGFNGPLGEILLTAPYMPEPDTAKNNTIEYDADTLLILCEQWLAAQPLKNSRHRQRSGSGKQKLKPLISERQA